MFFLEVIVVNLNLSDVTNRILCKVVPGFATLDHARQTSQKQITKNKTKKKNLETAFRRMLYWLRIRKFPSSRPIGPNDTLMTYTILG